MKATAAAMRTAIATPLNAGAPCFYFLLRYRYLGDVILTTIKFSNFSPLYILSFIHGVQEGA
jgi:hypothetical protein